MDQELSIIATGNPTNTGRKIKHNCTSTLLMINRILNMNLYIKISEIGYFTISGSSTKVLKNTQKVFNISLLNIVSKVITQVRIQYQSNIQNL